ncbi:dihydropteroate synthase [Alterileibacterium massiliense]|uniref:dihydropteroate synthase n=1 Tax=Alterileibacterium massiliense TaxID=1870997 RepID=UPI0008D90017|nr:dihydropteroate synthase [Alterileibacterium massiliense]
MQIGNKNFNFNSGKSVVMGILNVTPDSFSDGGKFFNIDDMLRQAEQMAKDGVDIFDVGGESTRPGGAPVSGEEERERVLPAISELKKRFDIPISVDTYRAKTAEQALARGADLINDVWGLNHPDDKNHEMARIISKERCPIIIMHNRISIIPDELIEKKAEKGALSKYPSAYIEKIIDEQKFSIDIAKEAGVEDDKIIIDPGIGFAKSLDGNIHAMNNAEHFTSLGYPVLLGISRKSIIGKSLALSIDEREEATIALNIIGRMKGHHIFRVHDVKANRRALDMCDVILNDER